MKLARPSGVVHEAENGPARRVSAKWSVRSTAGGGSGVVGRAETMKRGCEWCRTRDVMNGRGRMEKKSMMKAYALDGIDTTTNWWEWLVSRCGCSQLRSGPAFLVQVPKVALCHSKTDKR